MKRVFIAGAFILFAAMVQAQNVGIGTATPVARMQINHRSSTTVGLQLLDSTNLRSGTIRFSTINNPVGITIRGAYESSFNKGHYLDIISDSTFIATFRGDGNVGIGTFSPTAKLEVNGTMKIQGVNTLEFGAGVAGKETNAGKIGYQTFTAGALDIVGAGTTVSNRKINIFAEGGTTFNGQVKITGGTPAAGKVLTSDAAGLASWQNIGQHFIGESYGGGIVFYVYDNGQHGLIAATADQRSIIGIAEVVWYNGTYTITNAVRDCVGAGIYNTERIIRIGGFAADMSAKYQGGEFGDWYLPSKYELNLLNLQKAAVGGFAIAWYWSSSEDGINNAWAQHFYYDNQGSSNKADQARVRAIRAF